MTKTTNALAAGETLLVTAGKYSDYAPLGVFKIIKMMDPDYLINEFRKNTKISPHSQINAFLSWLVNENFLEELVSVEWNLGTYGELGNEDSYAVRSKENT